MKTLSVSYDDYALVSFAPKAKLTHIIVQGSEDACNAFLARMRTTLGRGSTIRQVVTLERAQELTTLNSIPLHETSDFPHLHLT